MGSGRTEAGSRQRAASSAVRDRPRRYQSTQQCDFVAVGAFSGPWLLNLRRFLLTDYLQFEGGIAIQHEIGLLARVGAPYSSLGPMAN